MRRSLVVFVLLLSACGPGPLPPLPEVLSDESRKRDSYPTQSNDPLPIDNAIRLDDLAKLRQLLAGGADPNARWGERGDYFPLQEILDDHHLYRVTEKAEMTRLLLAHGADPNARWCPFETRGAFGAGLSCTSLTGMTSLQFAALGGARDIAALLLDAGAEPMLRDWSGASALDYAFDEVLFELIARRQFPDLATRDRRALEWLNSYPDGDATHSLWNASPLSRTLASDGFISGFVLVRRLDSPADYWTQTDRRITQRVRTLLRIGANPNERIARDGWNVTPLAIALSSRQYRTAAILLANGADVNGRWCGELIVRSAQLNPEPAPSCGLPTGTTPLIWAASAGDREAMKLLLEFKADRSLRDWRGQSAMDRAETREMRESLNTQP